MAAVTLTVSKGDAQKRGKQLTIGKRSPTPGHGGRHQEPVVVVICDPEAQRVVALGDAKSIFDLHVDERRNVQFLAAALAMDPGRRGH